jgi:hypothetical protein
MRQTQKVFSRDLAALLKGKSVDRTALGSRWNFAYFECFVVKLLGKSRKLKDFGELSRAAEN